MYPFGINSTYQDLTTREIDESNSDPDNKPWLDKGCTV